MKRPKIRRPGTLRDVARTSTDLKSFGHNLRDWQHEVRDRCRGRADFYRRILAEPRRLADAFADGDVADAYLAAYALWLADRVAVPRVDWAFDRRRVASRPWFSGGWRAELLRDSPAHFMERNLFTYPDDSFLTRKIARCHRTARTANALAARKRSGLTQEEFARRIGVSVGTVRNWEQGRNRPRSAGVTLLGLLEKHPPLAQNRLT
ncbi:MAG: helix-turn-helix domain-containing protein [Opitutales bacterium]|nr:helix-turn-helix domain-containing protein [Opitutales bacterium]